MVTATLNSNGTLRNIFFTTFVVHISSISDITESVCGYEIFRHSLEEEKVEPFVTEGKKYWIGKDYSNFIYKDVTNLEKPFDGECGESFSMNLTPRFWMNAPKL